MESFFGTLSVGANGSAEKESGKFSPRKPKDSRTPKNDHRVSLNFKASISFLSKVKEGLQYKTERLQKICVPYINYALSAETKSQEGLVTGGCVQIRGQFIKAELDDKEQGVFLSGVKKTYWLSRYTRCTRCSIDVLLPDDLPPGKYWIHVCTKRADALCTSNSIPVTVEAAP